VRPSTRLRHRHPLAVPIVLAGAVIYMFGCSIPGVWQPGWVGQRRSCQLVLTSAGAQLWVGWGWPSKRWIEYKMGDCFDVQIGHECLGFLLGYSSSHFGGFPGITVRQLEFGIPWWFPVALLIAPRLERLERRCLAARWIRRRRRRGLCPGCGYDLRASSERCPECGRQITAFTRTSH